MVEASVEREAIQAARASVDYYFPYVKSIRATCHKVVVGYPEHPCHWRAKCGWQFGFADVARPLMELPTCHKAICDRCFKAEKEAAKAVAEQRVCEVGVDAE